MKEETSANQNIAASLKIPSFWTFFGLYLALKIIGLVVLFLNSLAEWRQWISYGTIVGQLIVFIYFIWILKKSVYWLFLAFLCLLPLGDIILLIVVGMLYRNIRKAATAAVIISIVIYAIVLVIISWGSYYVMITGG